MPTEDPEAIKATLKRTAAALRGAGVEFLLAGGMASWARGGPPTDHDLDLFVRPEDATRAFEVLESAGMRGERPPEEWLLKAWDGGVLVDLIFHPANGPVDDGLFDRADELEVDAVRMKVVSAGDLLASKLLALTEHHVDYDSVLEVSRALREQVDWDHVREQTAESPYAAAFFTLATALDIAPAPPEEAA